MTTPQMRRKVVGWIEEAVAAGARRLKACAVVGVSLRTLQRWKPKEESLREDGRPDAKRPTPANKLDDGEREQVLIVCNQPPFASLPPGQIVPRLADDGRYMASESTFYRILREASLQYHRGRARARQFKPITTHLATGPGEVWTWDITWLPSTVRGRFWYLYMINDLYSRFGVAWEVHDREHGDLAAELLDKAVLREGCPDRGPVLHGDNGSPIKCYTVKAKCEELGITPSHSRPRVSNDNAYIESFFRTLKYCPRWPAEGFKTLEDARAWVHDFMAWYHHEHRHSKLQFVTPAQRHRGEDGEILARRDTVYAEAKARHPERWSGNTRNWTPVGAVTLNPERIVLPEAA